MESILSAGDVLGRHRVSDLEVLSITITHFRWNHREGVVLQRRSTVAILANAGVEVCVFVAVADSRRRLDRLEHADNERTVQRPLRISQRLDRASRLLRSVHAFDCRILADVQRLRPASGQRARDSLGRVTERSVERHDSVRFARQCKSGDFALRCNHRFRRRRLAGRGRIRCV